MSLYNELKRRNVIRVGVAYLVGAFLLFEVANAVFSSLGIPEWGVRLLAITLALGFLPALVISWSFVLTSEGVVRDTPLARSSVKRLDVITVILVVAVLAFIVADVIWFSTEWGTTPVEAEGQVAVIQESEPVQGDYPPNSIAVLPFVNMSDDPANEYFSDGISEELLSMLARVPELSVPSRSSAFLYKGKDFTVSEVARDLNVRHILEGSVRKNGDRVRITVQLIDTRSDTHLWSETFDRMLDDIFAIQDEIASAVVDTLKLTLLGGSPQSEKVNPEAYALYLQARFLNAQGAAQAFEQTIDLYKQALVLAPDYARAWRGLAVVYMNQANKGLRPKNESYELAWEAVDMALDIDPEYAMAHATRGVLVMTHNGDMAQAAPHFERALSLEPNNLVLLSYSSSLLLRLGRLEEAIAIREYDVAHDPLDPIGYNNLSFAYLMAQRPDEALSAIDKLLMLAPRYSAARHNMGKALLLKGEYEESLEAMRSEPSEIWRLIGLAMVYTAMERASDVDVVLAELIDRHGQDWAYHIAMLLAYRGDADGAFDWLNIAVEQKATSLTYVAVEPLFANIRGDARCLPFLESIGMSPAQLVAIDFKVSLPD